MDLNILIVDDEQAIRALMVSLLKEQGYRVLVAENVAEARDLLRLNQVDLVITDLNMPEEHGIVLIQHLKVHFPRIGVIVATVLDDPLQAKAVLDMGIYGYIIKPFNKNLVNITVANAIRRMHLENEKEFTAKELESRYLTILDNIHVGMMLVNCEYEITELNREMRSWFDGVTVGDHVSVMDQFVADVSQTQSLKELIGRVVKMKVPEYERGRFDTTKGERVLEVSLFPVFTERQNVKQRLSCLWIFLTTSQWSANFVKPRNLKRLVNLLQELPMKLIHLFST